MQSFFSTKIKLAALLVVAAIFGCSENSTEPSPLNGFDAAPLLGDIANNVILSSYQNLDSMAQGLSKAVAALDTNPTAANLDAAREAWRQTRRPWEQSEGFLFGPVDTKGIDPSIDSWPLNVVDLNAVMASPDSLNKAYVDALEDTQKGFHTIEYLLFGVDGTKQAADLTAREREYLLAVTASFKGATAELADSWAAGGENFASVLATAGNGSTVYPSQRAALQELVQGMIGICDEVANGKIADPFSQADRNLEESRFSDNSNSDFADNIRSVENVYLGKFGIFDGNGIEAMVQYARPALDARIRSELTAAITAIGQMTPSFGQAIIQNPTAVRAAQQSVQTLQATLEAQVLPLVSN